MSEIYIACIHGGRILLSYNGETMSWELPNFSEDGTRSTYVSVAEFMQAHFPGFEACGGSELEGTIENAKVRVFIVNGDVRGCSFNGTKFILTEYPERFNIDRSSSKAIAELKRPRGFHGVEVRFL